MRRLFCWIMYAVVIRWPFSAYRGIGGWIWFAMLPWAGEWAYYWSEPAEYRHAMDAQRG